MRKIDFNPKNIIVRMPNWIGDLIMATPILSDLREKFPDSVITAMCKRPLCDLLENDEALNELYCFIKPSNRFFEKRIQKRNILAKLRSGEYDLGILLTNSFSSAWWFWQGRVQNRLGYDAHLRNVFLDYPIPYPSSKDLEKEHQVITYKRLLEPLGIKISDTKPRLFVEEQEMVDCLKLLEHHGYVPGKCLIGVNPSASYGMAKCWPAERFREIIQKLIEQRDCYVLCFGDEKSIDQVKQICAKLPERVINLAGLTSLKELVCAIKYCSLLLTNDSGPMHIAAAVNTPLIALFGSTNEMRTGPYQTGRVIQKNVACSPCYLRECPIDFRCMKNISVLEVLQAIEKELDVQKNS